MALAPGVTPAAAAAAGHSHSRQCTLGCKFAGLGAVVVLLVLGPELRLASDGASESVRQGDVRVRFLGAVDTDTVASASPSLLRSLSEVMDPVCAGWRCTCQGFSNLYLTWDWHWGGAPEEHRAWWSSRHCKTTPETTTVSTMPPPTDVPVTSTTPAHAPPKAATLGFNSRTTAEQQAAAPGFVPPQLPPPPPPKRPTGSMRLAVVTEVGARGQVFTAQFVALLFEEVSLPPHPHTHHTASLPVHTPPRPPCRLLYTATASERHVG